MRLLVVGAGSTGGYFGGKLAQAGNDVTFLVRSRRAQQLAEHGLQIKSPHGDFKIMPKVVTAETLNQFYDVIFLSVKGFSLQSAMADIAPAVGPETIIFPVLNGMSHMDILTKRFSSHNVIGGFLKVVTTLDKDGTVIQMTDLQQCVYGEVDGADTPRIRALDALMQTAPIGARLSHEIIREMWEKWLFLSSAGVVTCLMRGNIGEIEACVGGKEFALAIFDEILSIVLAVGEKPSENCINDTKKQLTTKGSPMTTSMYRDLSHGYVIEVENIVGDMVRYGQQAGIKTPLLSAAYVNLRIHQNRVESAANS